MDRSKTKVAVVGGGELLRVTYRESDITNAARLRTSRDGGS
jgi:hypothetical protein